MSGEKPTIGNEDGDINQLTPENAIESPHAEWAKQWVEDKLKLGWDKSYMYAYVDEKWRIGTMSGERADEIARQAGFFE